MMDCRSWGAEWSPIDQSDRGLTVSWYRYTETDVRVKLRRIGLGGMTFAVRVVPSLTTLSEVGSGGRFIQCREKTIGNLDDATRRRIRGDDASNEI